MRVKVGIIGAASLSTSRMLGLLLEHPGVEVVFLGSTSEAGQPVHVSHPQLRGLTDLRFEKVDDPALEKRCDVMFLTRPAGLAFETAERLLKAGIKVIDLSADFRTHKAESYLAYYGHEVKKAAADIQPLLDQAVYGLPETHSDAIANARLVANPGCYASSIILALAPLAKAGLLPDAPIPVDAFSGISGAGRGLAATSMFVHANENVFPYKTGTHRHTPEVEQELGELAGAPKSVFFNPHVVPLDYGILTNIFLPASSPSGAAGLVALYRKFFAQRPFVRVLEAGELPQCKSVQDTNFCDIGLHLDARTGWLRVSSALDNTIKGAGGCAIQNLNLMTDQPETLGLPGGMALARKPV